MQCLPPSHLQPWAVAGTGKEQSILCTSKQQSLVSLLAKHRPNDLPNAGNLIVRSAREEITNAVVQAATSAVHNLNQRTGARRRAIRTITLNANDLSSISPISKGRELAKSASSIFFTSAAND